MDGARSRNRTGTELPPPDFESGASTNFTTRAFKRNYCIKKYFKDYLKCRKKDAKFEASQKNYFFFAFLEAATASLSCLPTLNLTTFVAGDL